MKHIVLSFAVLALLIISCKNDKPKGGEAQDAATATENAALYNLNTDSSEVKWRGYKITDGKEEGHYGTLKFNSDGQFSVTDGKLTGGNFTIDMNTIVVTDIDEENGKSKLEAHLKNADFFEVEKYPTANFEITKVTPLTEGEYNTEIEGNFTIKDTVKSYKFMANTSMTDNTFTIKTAEFDINRQEFRVTYKSTMKDVVLKDNITLQIVVVGDKM